VSIERALMGAWVEMSTSCPLRSRPPAVNPIASGEPDWKIVATSSPLIPSCAPISPWEPST
jgi:hypothetical protein